MDTDPEIPRSRARDSRTRSVSRLVSLLASRSDAKKIKTLAFSIDLWPDFLFSLLCLHNELPLDPGNPHS